MIFGLLAEHGPISAMLVLSALVVYLAMVIQISRAFEEGR